MRSWNILRRLRVGLARTMLLAPLIPTAEMTASASNTSSPHLRIYKLGGIEVECGGEMDGLDRWIHVGVRMPAHI